MGCRDRDSNFNAYLYRDGGWGVGWSLATTVEAPNREILEQKLQEFGGVWVVQPSRTGTLIAGEANIAGISQGIFYSADCLVHSS
jgi:hypothetical protein